MTTNSACISVAMRDLEGLNSVRRSVCMSSVAATEYRPARRLLNGTNDRTAQLGLSRVAGSLSWSSGRGRIGVEAGRGRYGGALDCVVFGLTHRRVSTRDRFGRLIEGSAQDLHDADAGRSSRAM